MEGCCTQGPGALRSTCPECGRPGRPVDRVTLEALLRPEALARLEAGDHRFCPTAECPSVYFGPGDSFRREDVLVPVFQKQLEGDGRTVCYCFDVAEATIRREVVTSGDSASADRIRALVQSGRCACEVRNPQGTCCLGNVAMVVASARAWRESAPAPSLRAT